MPPRQHRAHARSCRLLLLAMCLKGANASCVCENSCLWGFRVGDGACDDGGPGAEFDIDECDVGADCDDCGPRCPDSGDGGAAQSPPSPPQPPLPPSPPPVCCQDTCHYPNDGICDDGGDGSFYDDCALGTDCGGCGNRCPLPPQSPTELLSPEAPPP
eukprot:2701366-Prymnesium_polylepis.1